MTPYERARQPVVIFDYDDTIVASKVHRRSALIETILQLGRTPDVAGFDAAYGKSFVELIASIDPNGTFDEFFPAYLEHVRRFPAEILPGARETLVSLSRAGVPIGVLSSSDSRLIQAEIETLGLDSMLTAICGSDCPIAQKPDPASFGAILKTMELNGSEVIEVFYVGDALTDLEMSRHAGNRFIAVCTGSISAEQFLEHGVTEQDVCATLMESEILQALADGAADSY